MKNKPLVSIIIPIYNKKYALSHTLKSIKSQAFSDFEVLLIDDGSTDGSSDICTYYQNNDNRFIYERQPNSGVSSARNKGISMANGAYLFFCDADDELPEDAIANLVSAAENSNADLILGGFAFRNINTGNIGYPYNKERTKIELSIHDNLDELWKSNNMLSSCVKLYRTSIIRESNLHFNTELIVLEDFDFVLSYLEQSQTIISIPEYVYYQDLGYGVKSFRARTDYMDCVDYVYQKYLKFLREMNIESNSLYMQDIQLVAAEDLKAIAAQIEPNETVIKRRQRTRQIMRMNCVKDIMSDYKFDEKTTTLIQKYGFTLWLMGYAHYAARIDADFKNVYDEHGKMFAVVWKIWKNISFILGKAIEEK